MSGDYYDLLNWLSSDCRAEFKEPAVCHLFLMGVLHANNGYSASSTQPEADNPVLYDFTDSPPNKFCPTLCS